LKTNGTRPHRCSKPRSLAKFPGPSILPTSNAGSSLITLGPEVISQASSPRMSDIMVDPPGSNTGAPLIHIRPRRDLPSLFSWVARHYGRSQEGSQDWMGVTKFEMQQEVPRCVDILSSFNTPRAWSCRTASYDHLHFVPLRVGYPKRQTACLTQRKQRLNNLREENQI